MTEFRDHYVTSEPPDGRGRPSDGSLADGQSLPTDVVERLAGLGRLTPGMNLGLALQQVATVGSQVVPGAAAVSVTVRQEGQEFTAAASDELARELDNQQYDAGDGPCLQALRTATTVRSPDLRAEARWPQWSPVAVAAGMSSMLSVALPATTTLPAVLNIYGSDPDALTGSATYAAASSLAAHTVTLMNNLDLYSSAEQLSRQLQEAIESRATIEQAKGVLMAMLGTNAETAFAYLVRLSQQQHRKLRDIAATVTTDAAAGRTRQQLAQPG